MDKITKPTLLVLAAGMGSRYGSLKQIDGIGPNGEAIIEYSIFDAIRAGFGKVVFVIRDSIEKEFREVFDKKFKRKIEVDYVFQELENLPDGYTLPTEREKPWGTAHAVLMAANTIKEPFAVINADDFYGPDAYAKLAEFFQNENLSDNKYCMVGYLINKTLSEHGFVSRGVCTVDNNNYLANVVERTKIGRQNGKIVYHIDDSTEELTGDETVSMNFWGFMPSFFKHLSDGFNTFLDENINTPKSEYFIPLALQNLIESNTIKLEVLKTDFEWFGVTYKEDKPDVMKRINSLIDSGVYPEKLWSE